MGISDRLTLLSLLRFRDRCHGDDYDNGDEGDSDFSIYGFAEQRSSHNAASPPATIGQVSSTESSRCEDDLSKHFPRSLFSYGPN